MPGRLRSGQVCGRGFSLSTVGSVAPTQGVRPALPSHWPRGWLQDGCRTLRSSHSIDVSTQKAVHSALTPGETVVFSGLWF